MEAFRAGVVAELIYLARRAGEVAGAAGVELAPKTAAVVMVTRNHSEHDFPGPFGPVGQPDSG